MDNSNWPKYYKEMILTPNIFLNPNLKYLILSGLDLSGALSFFNEFLNYQDRGDDIFHKEIPEEKIKQFQAWFSSHSYFVKEDEIVKTIKKIPIEKENWTSCLEEFPEPAYTEALNFPSEEIGFRLEGKKVADLWLDVLDYILKFGRDKKSQYGEMQREIKGAAIFFRRERC